MPKATSTQRVPGATVGIAATVWFGSVAASIVLFQIVASASGHGGEKTSRLPFWLHPTVSMVVLWVPTLAFLWFVSRRHLTARFARDYGLAVRPVDLLGIPIGVACQLLVLRVVYWPLERLSPDTFGKARLERPGRELTDRALGGWKVVLVVAVVVGAPLVEELLYRGLVLRGIESRLRGWPAAVLSAAWFAVAHLQPIQFVGLFVFGVVLAVCWQRTGRLGMGIVAHAAFNATSVVMLWPKR